MTATAKAIIDIDYDHDHGAGRPHGHDWDWTQNPPVRLPGRTLTAGEKEEEPMKIVSYKDYVAGWLDSSIHAFLGVLQPMPETKYALITCLDSNFNPAALRDQSPELKPLANKVTLLGSSLLLPTELLLDADSRRQVFFGFDEIWFFPSKSIQPKPSSASLVGPARVNRARLNKLGRWMSENACCLALGGGEGLNFVVRERGLARFLLGCSIEQPEPALA